jgi:5'-nucleotidase
MEAALNGLPAIALSQYFGPGNIDLENAFDAAAVHGASLVKRLWQQGTWDRADYRVFYNVNFPPVAAAQVRGTRATAQGFRRGTGFSMEPHVAPNGRRFLWIKGGPQNIPTEPGTDAHANLDGYISVTPLRADLTAHEAIEGLRAAIE